MKRLVMVLMLMMIVWAGLMPVAAQCTPYTTVGEPGMLPIGTTVTFSHWEGGMRPVVISGVIEQYYITTRCPQAALFNMDPQTYVVYYGDPGPYHISVILNRSQMEVVQ